MKRINEVVITLTLLVVVIFTTLGMAVAVHSIGEELVEQEVHTTITGGTYAEFQRQMGNTTGDS